MEHVMMRNCSTLDEASRRIQSGEVIAFPTETFYGLGADPFNATSIDTLLELKGRQEGQGIPLIVDRAERVNEWIDEKEGEVYEKRIEIQKYFWPGPLTLVFRTNRFIQNQIHPGVFGSDKTLAVRVSSSPQAISLVTSLPNGVITSTSANPRGELPSCTAEDVRKYFSNMFVFSSEYLAEGVLHPSTIIDTTQYPFKVLREGAVSVEELSVCEDLIVHSQKTT